MPYPYVAILIAAVFSFSVTAAPKTTPGKRDKSDARNPSVPATVIANDSENQEETWDSAPRVKYSAGSAEDVTRGVRIEDIVEPPSEYHFAAFGKPDPFIPPMLKPVTEVASSIEIPIVSPLQHYHTYQLKVVGIWQLGNGQKKSLILTPKGEGIIAKVEDPIGRRGGKITDISDAGVKVREFSLAADGTRQFDDSLLPFTVANADKDDKIIMRPGDKKEPKPGVANAPLPNAPASAVNGEQGLQQFADDIARLPQKNGGPRPNNVGAPEAAATQQLGPQGAGAQPVAAPAVPPQQNPQGAQATAAPQIPPAVIDAIMPK